MGQYLLREADKEGLGVLMSEEIQNGLCNLTDLDLLGLSNLFHKLF